MRTCTGFATIRLHGSLGSLHIYSDICTCTEYLLTSCSLPVVTGNIPTMQSILQSPLLALYDGSKMILKKIFSVLAREAVQDSRKQHICLALSQHG